MTTMVLSVFLSVLLWWSSGFAQVAKLTVSYSSIAAANLPLWLAKDAGLFAKNGLDVQLVYIRGGTTVMMTLLSMESPISQTGGSSIVSANLRGADVVMIAGGNATTDWWLLSRPEIKSAEQLRGGAVGIAVFGGSSEVFARLALRKLGLTAMKDVALLQIGGMAERLSALESGRVKAVILPPPDAFIAQKRGFNTLAHVAQPFQTSTLASSRRYIREQPETVRRFVKAQIEAVHRMKVDRDLGLKILAKYSGSQDREIVEKSYDFQASDDKLSPKQYPTAEGIKNILDSLAASEPKAKNAKPEDFVDVSFIRELDQSGYIDALYTKK